MAKKSKKKAIVEVKAPEMRPPGTEMRENGVLYMTGKYDEEKVLPLVQQITEYNLMEDKVKPERITLFINSGGGVVFWAWMLIDAIKMSEIPVVTVGQGLVASCGVLTLMAGDSRVCTHNTSIMSHTYSWGSAGKEGELMAKVKEFEMASTRMLEHYKKCTGKSERYIRKNLLHAHDEWMTPDEAKKYGIIDEIWETY